MPKKVDHEKQRKRLADAALRIIHNSGLEQATVRNIAKESGLSVGSMRHYFSTQAELFAFCMNLFLARIEQRVEGFQPEGDLLQDMKRLLLQLIPLDEERIMESEVWFSFNAKVLIYPELSKLNDRMQEEVYKVSRFVVTTLVEQKAAKPELDIDLEAEKLYALIDGLAMHQLMQPGRLSDERLEQMLEQHLLILCDLK